MAQKRLRKCSFTMLEMVIVLLVMGMIFGIAVLQLDSALPESRLKQQVRKTVSLFDLASSQAITEGRPLALVFYKDTRTISLEYYKDPDLEVNVEILEEEDEPLYDVQWDESIELYELQVSDLDDEASESDHIVFLPEGSCDSATITWREVSGLKQRLELWPLLSKVSIFEVDTSEVWK